MVPNKYPVVTPQEGADVPDPLAVGRGDPDLFTSMPAVGFHEVIVHSPQHLRSITDLSPEQFDLALLGWRERVRAHSDLAYIHVIVNEGPSAGASLEHTHAQLYGLSFVPTIVARERERSPPTTPEPWAAVSFAICCRRR